jgi:hypothetical protein
MAKDFHGCKVKHRYLCYIGMQIDWAIVLYALDYSFIFDKESNYQIFLCSILVDILYSSFYKAFLFFGKKGMNMMI